MFGLTLKKVLWFLILIALVFAGVQYGNAYLTKYQFEDGVRQAVKYAASTRKGPQDVRRDVLDKAEELGIEIDPADIRITKRGPSFTLELDYPWVVNLKVYQQVLMFRISETGEMFGQ